MMAAPLETRSCRKRKEQKSLQEEYYIVKNNSLNALINSSNRHSSQCKGELEVLKVKSKIISVTLVVQCFKCGFTTDQTPMYDTYKEKIEDVIGDVKAKKEEIKKKKNSGPRHSKLNVALAAALTNTPMGASGIGKLFAHLNIHPGSEDALTRLINRVGPVNEKVAMLSMSNGIEELKQIQARGEEIGYSVDMMYNNRQSRRHGVPMEPATQAYHTTAGTNIKKIVGVKTLNKICLRCSRKETDRYLSDSTIGERDWECDNCTRTLGPSETISIEGKLLKDTVQEIVNKHELLPDYVTADGDTKISKVTKELDIELNKDVRHLSKCIVKKTNNADLNNFDGSNKTERTKQWNLFKADIIKRCNAENKKVHLKTVKLRGSAKLAKVNKMLKKTQDAILACHQGRCGRLCNKHSHVCGGYSKKYVKFSPCVKLTAVNTAIVKELIKKRLVDMMPFTYRNSGTNFNEGVNCAITKTCPKSTTFPRSMPYRVNRAIINVNEGSAKGTDLIKHALKTKLTFTIKNKLNYLETRRQRRKLYLRSATAKLRVEARNKFLKAKYELKKQRKHKLSEYKKGIDV